MKNMDRLVSLFCLLFCSALLGQISELEEHFVFEKNVSDTVYLVEDKNMEGAYLVMNSQKELDDYFESENFDKTGEIINEYQMSAEEFPDRYVARIYFVIESYQEYLTSQNRDLPETFDIYDWWNLDEEEHTKFRNYLSVKWEVPFELQSGFFRAVPQSYLYISKSNWEKKMFLDKVNGLLLKAFEGDPSLKFTFSGMESKKFKSVLWAELGSVKINRDSHLLVIATRSGSEMEFPYKAEKYSEMTDFHVQFLAAYHMMSENESYSKNNN